MAKIYIMGEILVEIMRDKVDSPLNQKGIFLGPFPSGAPAIFISTVAQLDMKLRCGAVLPTINLEIYC